MWHTSSSILKLISDYRMMNPSETMRTGTQGSASLCLLIILVLALTGCRKSEYLVEEVETIRDNGAGTGTTTWNKNKDYLLEGLVFVNDGQTLTIEAGTVIRAKTGQGSAASALIVARGGAIIAEGTSSEPIIFTCENDDLRGSIQLSAKGLWGGVIILGTARINNQYGENHIEGIPLSEPRATYGGFSDDHSAGIFRYVSIRHSGTNLGEGNEINGLTLGGVGNGTIIEHIEVISNADDGFEFFGGTVNAKYLIAYGCQDDGFDYDEGYRGRGQFWAGLQDAQECDLLLEAGGGSYPENGQPLSFPMLYNLTLVGSGADNERSQAIFSRNAAGWLGNSILLNQQYGISIEYKPDLEDSFQQFENGNLQLLSNIFFDVADNDTNHVFKVYTESSGIGLDEQNTKIREHFSRGKNSVEDPGLTYAGGTYRLVTGDYVFAGLAPYPDDWFDEVRYKGAFGTYNWASGWSLISQAGILQD
jgi:hypothetical protein